MQYVHRTCDNRNICQDSFSSKHTGIPINFNPHGSSSTFWRNMTGLWWIWGSALLSLPVAPTSACMIPHCHQGFITRSREKTWYYPHVAWLKNISNSAKSPATSIQFNIIHLNIQSLLNTIFTSENHQRYIAGTVSDKKSPRASPRPRPCSPASPPQRAGSAGGSVQQSGPGAASDQSLFPKWMRKATKMTISWWGSMEFSQQTNLIWYEHHELVII